MPYKIIALIISLSLLLISCGGDKIICIKDPITKQQIQSRAEQYGIFNQDQRNPKVHYRVIAGNVVLSVIFIESIVIPVILIGWYLWEADDPMDPQAFCK